MAVVVAYDPRWPARFAAERDTLLEAIGPLLVGPVEHIGSTAIPGLDAKPVIDMMAPVAGPADARAAGVPLADLGYVVRPHRVDAVLFVRTGTGGDTHHLHLTEPGSRLWCERLLFRDAVRADPVLRAEYTALKWQLLEASGGAVYDSAGKREFVRRVLASCGHDLRDDLHGDGRSGELASSA